MTTHERRTIVTRLRAIIDGLFTSLCSLLRGVNSRAELVTIATGLRRRLGDYLGGLSGFLKSIKTMHVSLIGLG